MSRNIHLLAPCIGYTNEFNTSCISEDRILQNNPTTAGAITNDKGDITTR